MAEMPSNIASSVAQSGIQSMEVARGSDAARANAASAESRQSKAVDEAGSSVDTDDEDNQVCADAEGGGSEGRAFEEGATEEEQTDGVPDKGITKGEDGQLHLDLEA